MTSHPPHLRPRTADRRGDRGDFLRVLAILLTVAAFILPAGEVAVVVVANSDDAPRVMAKRGRPLSHSFVLDRSNWVVSNDDALEDGPEDDDFQPGPDRTRGSSVRHAACPSPLTVLCVDSPPSDDCLNRSPPGRRWASSAGAAACPALDTSVQFLC